MAQDHTGTFKEYPGVYTYGSADGHKREAHPTQLKSGEWVYVWAWAGCADDCKACNSPEQDDYCGDRW